MTAEPDSTPDASADPADDSWMVHIPEELVGKALPAKGKAGVAPLRPLDKLADEIDSAPVVARAKARMETADAETQASSSETDAPPPPRSKPPRPHGEIWEGCPVKPLGHRDGVFYFLDPHGQMRWLTKLDAQSIMGLFVRRLQALYHAFPKFVADRKTGEVHLKAEHFDQQLAASAMFKACGERGLFDPIGAIRGPGAWTDDDGRLIYHCGDVLLVDGKEIEPQSIDGKVYTASPSIPHPAPAAKDARTPRDDATAALETFGTWQWERPTIDPMLMLAKIGIQMLGGALAARPVYWITGPRASGKTALDDLIRALLGGDKGLIRSADATKSGITSRIGHSSLAVMIDELEPGDEDDKRGKDIIALARIAYTGDQLLRGSADQKGYSSNVFSSFMFSSILVPGKLEASDRSRLIMMNLKPFPEGTPPLQFRAETWRNRGARIKRDLIDRWPTWNQRFDLWLEALAEHKIDGRAGKNWATILGMAQMALSEALPTAEELVGWTSKVAPHARAVTEDVGDDADDIVTWLMSYRFDPFRRGEQHTLGSWIKAAGWRPNAGKKIFSDSGDWHVDDISKKANTSLATIGIRVFGTKEQPMLFVATKPLQGLLEIFARSKWAGGAWSQSLQRLPGASASAASKYFGPVQTKGSVIPFQSIPGLLSMDDAADVQPASAASTPTQIGPEEFA
jgi:hypothetical protein